MQGRAGLLLRSPRCTLLPAGPACFIARPAAAASAECPLHDASSCCGDSAPGQLPYLLYIPDLEGCGATSQRQWPELASAFDLFILQVLPEERLSFESLVAVAVVGGWRAQREQGPGVGHTGGAGPQPRGMCKGWPLGQGPARGAGAHTG